MKQKSLDQLALIERYLNNKLSSEELLSFQKEMSSDESFKQLVQEHTLTHSLLDSYTNTLLKEELNNLGNQKLQKEKETLYQRRLVLGGLAAAVTVLIFIIPPFLSPRTPAAIAAKFDSFAVDDYIFLDDTEKIWGDILNAMRSKKFERASNLLVQHQDRFPSKQSELTLFLGISQYKTKKYTEAQRTLKQVSSTEITYEESQWFLALIYLRINDIQSSQEILEKIAQDSFHKHAKEASRALQFIDKLKN